MPKIKVAIAKEVFRPFPGFQVAVIAAKNSDNQRSAQKATHLVHDIEAYVHQTFHPAIIKNHSLLSPWTAAQKAFGKEARHYHTSVERLLHSVLKRKRITAKDTASNLLRYISIRHLLPGGADDADRLRGKVQFALAKGSERVRLFRKLRKGALYYHDQQRILGTKLDYWKNKKTEPDAGSKNILLHLAALPPVDRKKLLSIGKELQEIVRTFCGGTVKLVILDKKKPRAQM